MRSKYSKNLNIALTAMFAAIVFVLSYIGSLVQVTSFSSAALPLVAIIIGGIYIGPAAGSLLGFVFGITVFFFFPDTKPYMEFSVFYTFIACVVRATFVGWFTPFLFNLISKKIKPVAALIIAAVVGPVINTSIFTVCVMAVFRSFFEADAIAAGKSVLLFFLSLIIVNFISELVSSVVLCPAILVPLLKLKERMEK